MCLDAGWVHRFLQFRRRETNLLDDDGYSEVDVVVVRLSVMYYLDTNKCFPKIVREVHAMVETSENRMAASKSQYLMLLLLKSLDDG